MPAACFFAGHVLRIESGNPDGRKISGRVGIMALSVAEKNRRQLVRPGKREQIIRAARQLFLEQGYTAASVDKVTALAGVSKPTIYSHFENKKALFEAVVDEMTDKMSREVDNIDFQHDTPAKALEQAGQVILACFSHPEYIGLQRLLFAEANRHPELAVAFYEKAIEPLIATLAMHMEELAKRQAIHIQDKEEAAQVFIDLIKGKCFLQCLLGVAPSMDEADCRCRIERGVELFLAAFRA